ncbi:MAG: glycosyltransferase [Elusimicrobia bacterium]|nr:glycosyltransferase [Elusimicrobiota bacterium]
MAAEISVILPCFNEREGIVGLIREIRAVLEDRAHEVVVADDHSPDGTAEAVRQAFAGDAGVRVVVREKDPSLAKSIRAGLEAASGKILVVMDSDGNHDPKYLPHLIESLAHYDAAFGSRYLYGGRMSGRLRHNLSWAFNIFVRLATGGNIIDNLYGFFAIKRPMLEKCRFDDIFFGYGDYCIRLLYALEAEHAAILQIPMVNAPRRAGTGNSNFIRVFIKYFIATLRLALTHKRLSTTWKG